MNSLVPELILSDGDLPVAPSASVSHRDEQLLDSYSRTIAAVVNRVAPTVVNIRVLSGERGPGGGSGFIIARDGFILTNSHVVHGARELEVTLHDSRVFFPRGLLGPIPRLTWRSFESTRRTFSMRVSPTRPNALGKSRLRWVRPMDSNRL